MSDPAAALRTIAVADPPRGPDGRIDLDAVVDAVAAVTGTVPWLLESHPDAPATRGWSAVVAGAAGRLTVPAVGDDGTPDPFARLDERCAALGLGPHAPRTADQPWCDGGLVGAVSYDAVRAVERLPASATSDRPVPALDMVVADVVLQLDHGSDTLTLLHRPLPRARPRAELDGLLGDLRAAWRPHADGGRTGGAAPRTTQRVTTTLPAPAYRAAVQAALLRIADGDTFQVNLAQRLSGRWDGGLHELYRALRAVGPAPYGAALPTHGAGIAAVSPETFLEVIGGVARVRPIKGTRPRHADPVRDAALRDELAASAKDRAENVMVVDLERNDLGRVAVPGSVRVPRLLAMEGHPTVWHLVSDVEGRLRADVTWGELLRATFPCGSVTGAPKVSSMAIIDHLEPVRRGWYCGTFGWLGAGAASTAVAIRTAALSPDGTVDLGVGGGVVADSRPDAEHRESLDKAAAFLRAIDADT